MNSSSRLLKTIYLWSTVTVYTAIIYLTLPYGPILREKIYKSFSPRIIESYPLKNKSFQIKEKRLFLYSAEGVHGLGIYDISSPDSVVEASRVTSGDTTVSFFESRKMLYLAEGTAGVNIVDVNQPSTPRELSRIKLDGNAYDIIVHNQYMLVAAGNSGLAIADVTDKKNPVLINQLTLSGSCQKVRLHGNIAIVGTDSAGIFFVDLKDISHPQVVNSMLMPAAVTAILVHENFAYIGCLYHGIKIINISDINAPEEVGFYATQSPVLQMRYRNGYLLVANGENGLLLINVNRPQNPGLQQQYKTEGAITWVYHRYYYAYLADLSPTAYYVDIDTGRNFVVYFVAFLLSLVLVIIIIYLIRSRATHTIYNYIAMIVITSLYGYFLYGMLEIPIEAIHFLEYGSLGVLVYFAFENHINDALIFFVGAALITLIGIGDEFFQWLLPNRSWDFRDIGFNALSGGLVQLAIWHGLAPRSVKNKINRNSIRILRRYLLAVALVFAILLSLTPQFNTNLASHFSAFKFLDNPQPITEYGFKVFHPDIGGFFSRYRDSKLLQYDQEHGKEVAEVLNSNYRTSYSKFLKLYAPGNAPFIHEMRVHIFRRDRYFQDRRLWVAYKENLILENFFSNSLQPSLYKWQGDEMQQCQEQLGEQINEFYVSPVSANVITSFSLKTVWSIFFIFTGVVLGVEYYLWRRKF